MNRARAAQPRRPRPLAGFLRRLHHAAVRFLRGALRLCQGRPEETDAGFAGDRHGLPLHGGAPRRGRQCIARLPAETTQLPSRANVVMGEDVLSPAQVKDDLDRLRRDLTETLSSQIAAHSVSLEMGRDGLVISLREAGFFDSGSAAPKPEALPTLQQIAGQAGRHAVRSAHRGPHRQRAHSQRGIRLELGALVGPRHAHCAALSRYEGDTSGPNLGRRLRRVSSRRQQRDCSRARRKPPRRSRRDAAHEDQLRRTRRRAIHRRMAQSDGWGVAELAESAALSRCSRSLTSDTANELRQLR